MKKFFTVVPSIRQVKPYIDTHFLFLDELKEATDEMNEMSRLQASTSVQSHLSKPATLLPAKRPEAIISPALRPPMA